MKRAERRYASEKKKVWAADVWFRSRNWVGTPKCIGKTAATPCSCSKECCGNPRRHEGALTRQEIRHAEFK